MAVATQFLGPRNEGSHQWRPSSASLTSPTRQLPPLSPSSAPHTPMPSRATTPYVAQQNGDGIGQSSVNNTINEGDVGAFPVLLRKALQRGLEKLYPMPILRSPGDAVHLTEQKPDMAHVWCGILWQRHVDTEGNPHELDIVAFPLDEDGVLPQGVRPVVSGEAMAGHAVGLSSALFSEFSQTEGNHDWIGLDYNPSSRPASAPPLSRHLRSPVAGSRNDLPSRPGTSLGNRPNTASPSEMRYFGEATNNRPSARPSSRASTRAASPNAGEGTTQKSISTEVLPDMRVEMVKVNLRTVPRDVRTIALYALVRRAGDRLHTLADMPCLGLRVFDKSNSRERDFVNTDLRKGWVSEDVLSSSSALEIARFVRIPASAHSPAALASQRSPFMSPPRIARDNWDFVLTCAGQRASLLDLFRSYARPLLPLCTLGAPSAAAVVVNGKTGQPLQDNSAAKEAIHVTPTVEHHEEMSQQDGTIGAGVAHAPLELHKVDAVEIVLQWQGPPELLQSGVRQEGERNKLDVQLVGLRIDDEGNLETLHRAHRCSADGLVALQSTEEGLEGDRNPSGTHPSTSSGAFVGSQILRLGIDKLDAARVGVFVVIDRGDVRRQPLKALTAAAITINTPTQALHIPLPNSSWSTENACEILQLHRHTTKEGNFWTIHFKLEGRSGGISDISKTEAVLARAAAQAAAAARAEAEAARKRRKHPTKGDDKKAAARKTKQKENEEPEEEKLMAPTVRELTQGDLVDLWQQMPDLHAVRLVVQCGAPRSHGSRFANNAKPGESLVDVVVLCLGSDGRLKSRADALCGQRRKNRTGSITIELNGPTGAPNANLVNAAINVDFAHVPDDVHSVVVMLQQRGDAGYTLAEAPALVQLHRDCEGDDLPPIMNITANAAVNNASLTPESGTTAILTQAPAHTVEVVRLVRVRNRWSILHSYHPCYDINGLSQLLAQHSPQQKGGAVLERGTEWDIPVELPAVSFCFGWTALPSATLTSALSVSARVCALCVNAAKEITRVIYPVDRLEIHALSQSNLRALQHTSNTTQTSSTIARPGSALGSRWMSMSLSQWDGVFGEGADSEAEVFGLGVHHHGYQSSHLHSDDEAITVWMHQLEDGVESVVFVLQVIRPDGVEPTVEELSGVYVRMLNGISKQRILRNVVDTSNVRSPCCIVGTLKASQVQRGGPRHWTYVAPHAGEMEEDPTFLASVCEKLCGP